MASVFPYVILAFGGYGGDEEDPLYEWFRLTRLAHWKPRVAVVEEDDMQEDIEMEMEMGTRKYFIF